MQAEELLQEETAFDHTVNEQKKHRDYYIPVKYKFIIITILCILIEIGCVFLCIPWFMDLADVVGEFLAILIIGGVAIVPGYLNIFLIFSTIFDNQKYEHDLNPNIPITIIIASYNEGDKIYNTLEYIHNQDFEGNIRVILADNNSTDDTYAEVLRAQKDFDLDIHYIFESKQGKHFALNTGLTHVETEYVITLDADTLLHKKALRFLVARILQNKEVVAVAGAVMVKNSRTNLLTKMQEWDYFISMASIKKMQGLFQGTLVAQGAFSIYNTERIREVGGWPDSIGEDIVLTWKFLENDDKVYYEPLAVSFTDVPSKLSHFAKQRSRWARGMIEGFRAVKPWKQPNMYYKYLTMMDIAIIYMDFSYTFFFIPGVVLLLFGIPIIVGYMYLLVLPLTLVSFYILYSKEKQNVFNELGLKVRRNIIGFILFILCYQMIMSPVSLYGYVQEFTKQKRVWK